MSVTCKEKKSPNIRTGSAPVTAKKLVTGKLKNILSYSVGNKHKKTIILIVRAATTTYYGKW